MSILNIPIKLKGEGEREITPAEAGQIVMDLQGAKSPILQQWRVDLDRQITEEAKLQKEAMASLSPEERKRFDLAQRGRTEGRASRDVASERSVPEPVGLRERARQSVAEKHADDETAERDPAEDRREAFVQSHLPPGVNDESSWASDEVSQRDADEHDMDERDLDRGLSDSEARRQRQP